MFRGKHISFEGATFGGEHTNGFDGATFVGDRAPGMRGQGLVVGAVPGPAKVCCHVVGKLSDHRLLGKIVGLPYHLSSASYIHPHSQSIHPTRRYGPHQRCRCEMPMLPARPGWIIAVGAPSTEHHGPAADHRHPDTH